MSEPPAGVRHRTAKRKTPGITGVSSGSEDEQLLLAPKQLDVARKSTGMPRSYKLALAVITALAFVTRFHNIGHPNEVVFDEVHFGKVCCFLDTHLFGRVLTATAVCFIRRFRRVSQNRVWPIELTTPLVS